MERSFAILMAAAIVAGTAWGGSLDTTNAPGPTMRTLDELYQKVDAYASPRTLSATTTAMQAGYYATTNLDQVDTDLREDNIKKDVLIFGMDGTHESGGNVYTNSKAVKGKTGQTVAYKVGDDGYYKKGFAWPSPRFTVGSGATENCVVDNLTGLMWLQDPDLTFRDWSTAVAYCEALDGSSGRGGYTDWRLPNVLELQSLIDYGSYAPALPAGHPFGTDTAPIYPDYYSASTTFAPDTTQAFMVDMGSGGVGVLPKTRNSLVWPVRGP